MSTTDYKPELDQELQSVNGLEPEQGGPLAVLQKMGVQSGTQVKELADVQAHMSPEEQADYAIRVNKALMKYLCSISNPEHWVDFGGTPFPNEKARSILCSRLGVKVQIVGEKTLIETKEDSFGKYRRFQYWAVATCFHPFFKVHTWSEDMGAAETREKFFNGASRLPLEEVNEPNVQKKAITNAKGRALKGVLGFYPTWEELREGFKAAGKDPDKVSTVQYKGKSQTEHQTTKVHDEIGKMLMEMSGDDTEIASNMLYAYTKFPGKDGKEHGCRSLRKLSEKWARSTLPKVREAYQEFLKEREGYDDEGGEA